MIYKEHFVILQIDSPVKSKYGLKSLCLLPQEGLSMVCSHMNIQM